MFARVRSARAPLCVVGLLAVCLCGTSIAFIESIRSIDSVESADSIESVESIEHIQSKEL